MSGRAVKIPGPKSSIQERVKWALAEIASIEKTSLAKEGLAAAAVIIADKQSVPTETPAAILPAAMPTEIVDAAAEDLEDEEEDFDFIEQGEAEKAEQVYVTESVEKIISLVFLHINSLPSGSPKLSEFFRGRGNVAQFMTLLEKAQVLGIETITPRVLLDMPTSGDYRYTTPLYWMFREGEKEGVKAWLSLVEHSPAFQDLFHEQREIIETSRDAAGKLETEKKITPKDLKEFRPLFQAFFTVGMRGTLPEGFSTLYYFCQFCDNPEIFLSRFISFQNADILAESRAGLASALCAPIHKVAPLTVLVAPRAGIYNHGGLRFLNRLLFNFNDTEGEADLAFPEAAIKDLPKKIADFSTYRLVPLLHFVVPNGESSLTLPECLAHSQIGLKTLMGLLRTSDDTLNCMVRSLESSNFLLSKKPHARIPLMGLFAQYSRQTGKPIGLQLFLKIIKILVGDIRSKSLEQDFECQKPMAKRSAPYFALLSTLFCEENAADLSAIENFPGNFFPQSVFYIFLKHTDNVLHNTPSLVALFQFLSQASSAPIVDSLAQQNVLFQRFEFRVGTLNQTKTVFEFLLGYCEASKFDPNSIAAEQLLQLLLQRSFILASQAQDQARESPFFQSFGQACFARAVVSTNPHLVLHVLFRNLLSRTLRHGNDSLKALALPDMMGIQDVFVDHHFLSAILDQRILFEIITRRATTAAGRSVILNYTLFAFMCGSALGRAVLSSLLERLGALDGLSIEMLVTYNIRGVGGEANAFFYLCNVKGLYGELFSLPYSDLLARILLQKAEFIAPITRAFLNAHERVAPGLLAFLQKPEGQGVLRQMLLVCGPDIYTAKQPSAQYLLEYLYTLTFDAFASLTRGEPTQFDQIVVKDRTSAEQAFFDFKVIYKSCQNPTAIRHQKAQTVMAQQRLSEGPTKGSGATEDERGEAFAL